MSPQTLFIICSINDRHKCYSPAIKMFEYSMYNGMPAFHEVINALYEENHIRVYCLSNV